MLKKIIKYDMRETGKVTFFMCLLIVIMFALAVGFIGWAHRTPLTAEDLETANEIAMLIFSGYVIISSGFLIVEYIYLMVHYYRTMHGDRGYLSRTLPVSTKELLMGKIIAVSIFYCIIFFLWYICYLIVFDQITGVVIVEGQITDFTYLKEMEASAYNRVLELLGSTFIAGTVMIPFNVTSCMLAFELGQLMNKNKAVFGVGFYLAISFACGVLMGMFQILVGIEDGAFSKNYVLTTIIQSAIGLIGLAICFKLCCKLFDKHVDLE